MLLSVLFNRATMTPNSPNYSFSNFRGRQDEPSVQPPSQPRCWRQNEPLFGLGTLPVMEVAVVRQAYQTCRTRPQLSGQLLLKNMLAQTLPSGYVETALAAPQSCIIAAKHAPDPKRAGLILRNPPPLRRVIKRAAKPYPHFGLINPVIAELCDSMDTMKTAPRVNLHAVVLQSELDTLVPVDFQNEILECYGGPFRKVLMEGIDHDGLATEQHEPEICKSVRWLWKHTCLTNNQFATE